MVYKPTSLGGCHNLHSTQKNRRSSRKNAAKLRKPWMSPSTMLIKAPTLRLFDQKPGIIHRCPKRYKRFSRTLPLLQIFI